MSSTQQTPGSTPKPAPRSVPASQLGGTLIRYRVMAFVTGIMLLSASITWLIKQGTDSVESVNGPLWMLHGFCFLLYCVTVLDLGIRARWAFTRIIVVGLCGMIPVITFVAEHVITKFVRAHTIA